MSTTTHHDAFIAARLSNTCRRALRGWYSTSPISARTMRALEGAGVCHDGKLTDLGCRIRQMLGHLA